MTDRLLRELVLGILHRPGAYRWTVQGFGMVRCYPAVGDTVRLNIWHRRFAVPNVSQIHDHPWDLESLVLAGELINRRYLAVQVGVAWAAGWATYQHLQLKPGEGGGPVVEPDTVRLVQQGLTEVYGPGDDYRQRKDEVHETLYEDGTVTINLRTNRGPDRAHVYWREGPWVSAHPRLATSEEAEEMAEVALLRMREVT